MIDVEHQHFDKSIASGGRFYARMPLGESRFDVTGRAVTVINNILQEEYYTGVRNVSEPMFVFFFVFSFILFDYVFSC